MAKAIRWKVPFTSLKGTDYEVDIYEEGWSGGVTTLVAADNPLTVNESDSDDYFTPVRTQTGYLRIINTGNMPNAIFSTGSTQHYVELKDDEGNIHWKGFLSPTNFDTDWGPTPYEVELPVVSLLETLKGFELETSIAIKSIRSIFAQAFAALGVYPDGLHIANILDGTTFLDYNVSTLAWISENDFDANDNDWVQFESTDFFTIFEDICRFWGLTLRECQGQLWFCATDVTGYYIYYDAQSTEELFIHDGAQSSSEVANNEDILDYTIANDDHKVSILQGKKKVTVISDFGARDEILKLPSFESFDQGDKVRLGAQMQRLVFPHGFTVRQWAPQSSSTDYMEVYNSGTDLNDSTHCDGGYPWNESIVFLGSFEAGSILGGCLLRLQDWDSDDDTPDSVELTDTLCLKGLGSYYHIAIPEDPIMITEGCLEINSTVIHLEGSTYNTSANGHLVLKLRVGNKYYNGSTWQSSTTTFSVGYSNGKINNTNTYDSDYDGAKGYIIPLSSMSGTIELQIYGPYDETYSGTYTLLLQNFNIKHYHLSSFIKPGVDRDENKYVKYLDNNFLEDYEVKNNLAFFQGNKMGTAFLCNAAGNAVCDRLTYADGTDGVPEKKLLARLSSWYNRTIRMIEPVLQYSTAHKPIDILTDEYGQEMVELSSSIDYYNDEMTLKLESNI